MTADAEQVLDDAVDGRKALADRTGGDAGGVQTGEDLGFTLKPRKPIRISRKRLGQYLEGDLSPELGIGGLIDLPHAPLADEGGDVVMGDAVTDAK